MVSSADLVQRFEACWSAAQLESHQAAGRVIDRVVQAAFRYTAQHVREHRPLSEY